MKESINDFRLLCWLAIEANISAATLPIDKRVLTLGFLSWTVCVKVEKLCRF